MAKGLLIAVLLGCGAPAMALAASGQPSTLQQFLAKRFKPGRGVFGAIASAIPVKLDPDSIAGMEGRKPDGSYWTSAFYNRSNTVMFDDPRNSLARFCTASGGALKRLRGFDLSPKHDLNFFSVRLTDGVGPYLVSDEVVGRWAASPPDGSFARAHDPYAGIANDAAKRIDERGALGLFSCMSAPDVAAWHVAILPTSAGAWDLLGDVSLQGDAAIMLSIREVDRAVVSRAEVVIAGGRQATAAAEARIAGRNAQDRAAADARAALELPKLRAFQSSVKVGDDTSCGLVLTINGPLVEVQVPDTVRLENGASRLFVKRTQLTAKRSPYTCYIHDPIARRSSLSASPEALMSQP